MGLSAIEILEVDVSTYDGLSPLTLIRRGKVPIEATLDGALILMDIETGLYFEFDAIASCIWGGVTGTVLVSDLIADIASQYDGDVSQIQTDVLEFLAFLAEKGMIETANQPSA